MTQAPGRTLIYGTAGGGLRNAGWAKSAGHARAGQRAELATAAVLDDWARNRPGVAVLHDLDVPSSKYTANVDHAVVSGREIILVDSKAWAPGFVWSFGNHGFRGLSRFDAATKRTLPMAVDMFTDHLARRGITGVRLSAALVVWCSRDHGTVRTWALQAPGARVIPGKSLSRRPGQLLTRRPADPAVVAALTSLLHQS